MKIETINLQKPSYIAPNKIIVGDSTIQGRGVFATSDIRKGEIIERCPLIQMEYRSKYQLDPTIFGYTYARYQEDKETEQHGFIMYIATGYGMLYNHQDEPNALWKFNYPELLGDIVAVKDIKANGEIFINYGNCYFNNKDNYTGIEQVKYNG
jgi:SET domain-containing protein